jgi:hypothetical protein
MLITLSTCSNLVQLVLLRENTGYVILVDVIHTQMYFDDLNSVCGTGSVTRTAHVNAVRPRTLASEDAITAAVERAVWHET